MPKNFAVWLLILVLTGGISGSYGGSPTLKDEAVGRKLYVNKCAKCHKFYDPAKYSDAQWRVWMQKMSRKAKLSSEQEKLLSMYVEQELRSKTQKPKAQGKH